MKAHTIAGREPCGPTFITALLTLTLAAGCDPADEGAGGDTGGATTGGAQGSDGQASGDGGDESGDGSTGGLPTDPIEIAGDYTEFVPPNGEIVHTISDTEWQQEGGDVGVTYTLVSVDNAARTAIGQDGNAFTKLQWTWTDNDSRLWYCAAVVGAPTAQEALAGPDADASDPANAGCGNVAWGGLIPAQ